MLFSPLFLCCHKSFVPPFLFVDTNKSFSSVSFCCVFLVPLPLPLGHTEEEKENGKEGEGENGEDREEGGEEEKEGD